MKAPPVKSEVSTASRSGSTRSRRGQAVAPPAYGLSVVDGTVIQMKKKNEDELKKKKSSPIQPKLLIGLPGDKYEREADAVADQVVRMTRSGIQAEPCCQEEKRIQPKPLTDQISPLRSDHAPTETSSSMESRLNASKGSGQPMPPPTLSFMEQAFGTDFSTVRIHANSEAARLNEELGAKAFILGQDVYFNQGQFRPETREGKWLLGHELGHVVQQGEGVKKAEGAKVISTSIRNIIQCGFCPYGRRRCEDDPNWVQARDYIVATQNWLRENLDNPEIDFELKKEILFKLDIAIKALIEHCDKIKKACKSGGGNPVMVGSVQIGNPIAAIGAAMSLLGIAYFATKPTSLKGPSEQALTSATEDVSTTMLSQSTGKQIIGNTKTMIKHLAFLLGETVCGQPPEHKEDPELNRNKWWKEIKDKIKNIQNKNLTPKQLLRELRKRWSDTDLAELREALRRAAELMGEDPPNFPPLATP